MRVEVTDCMRVSLGLDSDDVAIIRSEGNPENAWLVRRSGFQWLEEGLWLRVIAHLSCCERCRNDIGITIDDIRRELKAIWVYRFMRGARI